MGRRRISGLRCVQILIKLRIAEGQAESLVQRCSDAQAPLGEGESNLWSCAVDGGAADVTSAGVAEV